jgi:hypothetical protein
MNFSQRYGHVRVREVIQVDDMNVELRNSLWNVLEFYVWSKLKSDTYQASIYNILSIRPNSPLDKFIARVWIHYLKRPINDSPNTWQDFYKNMQEMFFHSMWYKVYDFIEMVIACYTFGHARENYPLFVESVNDVLKRELAGYRLVNGTIIKTIDNTEIGAVESASKIKYSPVREHLNASLSLLSNREAPDYRNSAKESILAIESLVMLKLNKKGTLGDLIKKHDEELQLHPALVKAIGALYGYSSDESGIRHAIFDSDNIGFNEAWFLHVLCCALINFIESKVTPA